MIFDKIKKNSSFLYAIIAIAGLLTFLTLSSCQTKESLHYTKFSKEVCLINEATQSYLSSPHDNTNISDAVVAYRPEGQRLDYGREITISWELADLEGGIVSSQIEVSENADYSDAQRFDCNDEQETKLKNLKTGTKYYYKITVTLKNGKILSEENTFTTAQTPRILNIDGIYNVRDIGAWNTLDGKQIKQGLLYRGTELDGAVEQTYLLTEDGKKEMLSVLGIKTDMDLRSPNVNPNSASVLGADIKHIYYDAEMYTDIFTDNGKEKTKSLFQDLAKSENYPIYLHCTYGCDRTGTVCMLLEAILGVSEEDIIHEYELSGLCFSHVNRKNYGDFLNELKVLPGNTLREKAENYLLSAGITDQEINKIKDIFLSK